MILTVTLNPALDLTYRVPELRYGQTHRVSQVQRRAGGKGINVARVLHALGEPVLAMAPLGGPTGAAVTELLAAAGVPVEAVPIGGETRRTVVVADGVEGTGFWEPGPLLDDAEWADFVRRFRDRLGTASAVALSGSLAPGLPDRAYAELIGAARAAGVPSVLDADGAALRHGIAAGPEIVKPNAVELARLVGRDINDPAAAVKAAAEIRATNAVSVVASLGVAGLVAVTGSEVLHAAAPAAGPGNATGAGDAAVAALTAGLMRRDDWADRLREAAAVSAAAAAAAVAGEIDPEVLATMRAGVTLRPFHP